MTFTSIPLNLQELNKLHPLAAYMQCLGARMQDFYDARTGDVSEQFEQHGNHYRREPTSMHTLGRYLATVFGDDPDKPFKEKGSGWGSLIYRMAANDMQRRTQGGNLADHPLYFMKDRQPLVMGNPYDAAIEDNIEKQVPLWLAKGYKIYTGGHFLSPYYPGHSVAIFIAPIDMSFKENKLIKPVVAT